MSPLHRSRKRTKESRRRAAFSRFHVFTFSRCVPAAGRWARVADNAAMQPRQRGKLVVISGPSGTGKSSICDELLRRIPNSRWSVSVTTRPPRGQELDNQHYRFVSREEFERMLARDELLEHAEYCGQLYGTPREPVERWLAAGDVVVLEIDVQGGAQIARRMPESIRIFVLPPTMETLKARLEGRRTESQALLEKRLAQADGEIGFARQGGCYQHFITNDILEDSVQQVMAIINREMHQA
jgi:guanylate kinase